MAITVYYHEGGEFNYGTTTGQSSGYINVYALAASATDIGKKTMYPVGYVVAYFHNGTIVTANGSTNIIALGSTRVEINNLGQVTIEGVVTYQMVEGDIVLPAFTRTASNRGYNSIIIGKITPSMPIYIHGKKLDNNLYTSYPDNYVDMFNEISDGVCALDIGYRGCNIVVSTDQPKYPPINAFSTSISFYVSSATSQPSPLHVITGGSPAVVYQLSGNIQSSVTFPSFSLSDFSDINWYYNVSKNTYGYNETSTAISNVVSNGPSGSSVYLLASGEPKSVLVTTNGATQSVSGTQTSTPRYWRGVSYINNDASFTFIYGSTYKINITSTEHGAVNTDKTAYYAYETVYIHAVPNEGYALTQLSVEGPSGSIAVTKISDTNYSFTMPTGAVTISAVFGILVYYTISVEQVSGGTVTVSKTSATEGEQVTITVTPQSGMSLSHLYVLEGINSIPVYDNTDTGTKYFFMPAGNVTIRAVFDGNPVPVEPSTPGGGGGEAGELPEGVISIPVPTYPASHALSTNFITGWKVDDTQLGNLHSFLFGESFADSIKQVLASPMDSIVSLSMLPMSTLPISSAREITLGNVSTGVSAAPLSSQFMTVVCGTVRYPIYFGSYLDFAPYTKVHVFLPYIGTRELNADLIVGKDVSITYNVDLLTGACVAVVGTQDSSGETMIGYHFNGNCLMHIPVTGRDISGQIMSVFDTFSRIGASVITGNPMPLLSGLPQIAGRAAVLGGATVAGGYSGALQGGDIANVIGGKPTFSVSGDVSGNAGFMDVQKPYLIISRPKLNMPAHYETVEGFPLNVWKNFSELSGYTRVSKCVLTDMGCTDDELSEIYQLLTTGVIF